VNDDFGLSGKTALVTGSGRNIRRAMVHARGRTWGLLIFQDLFKKEQ